MEKLLNQPAVLLGAIVLTSIAIRYAIVFILQKWLQHKRALPENFSIGKHISGSLFLTTCLGLLNITLPAFDIEARHEPLVSHASEVALILSATWFLVRIAQLIELSLYQIFDTAGADNMRQRKARTQLQFIFRIVVLSVCFLGFSAILLSFQGARQIGTSLIASAGVASVVLGFAAQKSLSNLIAGFQIAFTQPFRIDDVVIVEKEWGRIEEITLTYVVVKLWDLRRLVLPITYFVEKPFENWTRTSAKILGYAYLYVDYRLPVENMRGVLQEICEDSPLWDRQICLLQVTNMDSRTIELRCLVSARNASDAFDLRCVIREQMVAHIQARYPDCLPRVRTELPAGASEDSAT